MKQKYEKRLSNNAQKMADFHAGLRQAKQNSVYYSHLA